MVAGTDLKSTSSGGDPELFLDSTSLDTLCGRPIQSSLRESVGPGITSLSPDTLVVVRLCLYLNVEPLPFSQLALWSLCGPSLPLLSSFLREEVLVVVCPLFFLLEDGLPVDLSLTLFVLLGERLLVDDPLQWAGA